MLIPSEEKYSAKEQIRSLLEDQPEDATCDDILRELAFERMVYQGLSDVRVGRVVGHETALRRIRAWRDQSGRTTPNADLAQSLTDEPLTEVEQAWVEVAKSRMDELISERVQGIPAQVVFESIRSEMGWNE